MPDQNLIQIDFSNAAPTPAYDIVIGQGVADQTGTLISSRLGKRHCVIISDSNVAPLYQKRFEENLTAAGHTLKQTLVIPAGEASKNFTQIGALLNEMLSTGIDRKTLVIALGGGVVGDIAGFTASIAMRGIDFVQIPTTLLAQVDSSVGGKTGIDTDYGKNTIGTFYQPRLVIADVELLKTLPERELRAGYAEVVKYGLIMDRDFFTWCTINGEKLLNGDLDAQVYAVTCSCEFKAKIVAEDERETGNRALLNLGHTFGHALEAVTGFGSDLVHGEAVAIGTIMAFKMSVTLGLCPQQDYEDVLAHFKQVGLPTKPAAKKYENQLIALMSTDKKAESGKITLILPHGIGHAAVHKDADRSKIRTLWEEALA